MTGLELAVGYSVRWLLLGLVVTPLLLLVRIPAGDTPWILFHLTVLVVYGVVLSMRLAEELDAPWFTRLRRPTALLASAVSVVVLATGAVALLTLASSAALRLDPSMQFLQLLSALDIVWAAGATAIGARLLVGRTVGWVAGGIVVVICVWSVATYLNAVGYTPAGGWLVDGDAMWRYILPYDMAAAVIAITTLIVGVRKRASDTGSAQAMAQPSRQS